MSLGNRLERRTLQRDNDIATVVDYQDTSQEDTIYNTIKLGLIAAAGYGLYKSGALKDIMKPMLEVADSIAANGTDKASEVMHTIKQWSNLKALSPEQLAHSKTQRYSATPRSIFRDRESSIFYDLYKDVIEYSPDRIANFKRVREVMQASKADMAILTRMINDNLKALPTKRTDYLNTELYYRMQEVWGFEKMTNAYLGNQELQFNSRAMQSFMDNMRLTPEEAARELRQSGYRKLTAGDIMEEFIDDNGTHHLRPKFESGIDFSSRTNKTYTDVLERFETFIRDGAHTYEKNGKRTRAFSSGDWKDIIIDPHMRINEERKIIDYRMTMDAWVGFKNSLANDFKLPVVQFNPFKSLLGLDKHGRRQPMLGLIAPNQIDFNITGQSGRYTVGEYLKETFGEGFENKGIAIIDGKAFTTDTNNQLMELGSGFKVHDITFADGPYGLKPTVNAGRTMAGLDLGSPGKWSIEEYEELLKRPLTTREKIAYETAKRLDIGFMEARPKTAESAEGLDTISSFDEMTNNFINNVTKKIRVNGFEYNSVDDMLSMSDNGEFGTGVRLFNFKNIFGEGFQETTIDGKKIHPKMFTTSKEGFKLGKAFNYAKSGNMEEATGELEGFFMQFLVGGQKRDGSMSQFTTERTGIPWVVFNQLSEGLNSSSYLLGLSTDSKKTPWAYGANLLLKRALPVFALTQVPGIINYLSEPFFGGPTDETGNRDNFGKFMMRNVRSIDIGAHHALDLVGATKLFKFLGDTVPGTDQLTELLPLGLGQAQTAEERKEWIENGEDPVRKGRYWGSGNTPLSGGKIMYYRPNFYRRVEADVDFSDSKWGSRQEYYNNTWYPNPVNPFAPVNYFITNRNHYDYKHYYDRPYLQTSPTGSNIPLVGPLFGSTIGKVISPQHKMHLEYWQNGLQVNPEDEQPNTLLTEGKLYADSYSGNKDDVHVYEQINREQAEQAQAYQQQLSIAGYQAKQVTKRTIQDNSGVTFTERSILPLRTYDRYNTPYEVYTTPSGGMTVVDIPDELNLYDVNKDLRNFSINRIIGTNKRVDVSKIGGPDIPVGNDSPEIDNAFMYNLGEQYNWTGNVLGLKGFALQQFVTGHSNTNASVIEDSGYAYSLNNDFWEENLGGLGGNLSEITRRFVQARNNKTNYVNPIRNTMPSWMPGSNYFTDFKHGDPYSKIDNGEERLPGEGYERLNNIHGLMEFNIDSSAIGMDKPSIIQTMLNRPQNVDDKATKDLRSDIQKSWVESGLAIKKNVEINDTRNGISGTYDAMVNDVFSKTGVGIAGIKPVSSKELNSIRQNMTPLDKDYREMNYYLWASNNTNSNGYLYYVDKENPFNNQVIGFQYNNDLLKDTLSTVSEARGEIRDAVKKGIIGRGELYGLVDQYRILADTAPYSQEFQDVQAKISSAKLTKEETKEVAEIREQMQNVKEPLRVYPYKFKTSNLKYETVTISKIIDNNTIVTREYGKEHSVKFAGMRVSESNSEMYDEKRTKNEAAYDEIRKYMRPGSKIRIAYDADEHNKFSSDSTRSIRAVVYSHGTNVNQRLINAGHAKENENDDSPAGINARYTKGEIAFGSAMEFITHKVSGIPFIGNKFYQVRSPYEQYRKREVYSKDFQSWNNPIRDMLIPHVEENIANNSLGGVGGIMMGAFVGSLFGKSRFGKIVGATVGAVVPAIGKIAFAAGTNQDRDWRPKRRRDQEELNEYVDTLKYVKYTRLYNQYAQKAKAEDHFDVESFMETEAAGGVANSLKQKELTDFKRKVKLDFKHRDRYNFKYGDPKYVESSMNRQSTISAINKELSELQSERKVTKVPENALKAIEYKQMAEKTMYGYEPGDSLVNIMTALPKKERQYFKHFMDAPEEEKEKILRIAPSYLRRALQSTWGMHVDAKPTLQEYFEQHALPDANWIGWDEGVNMDDVKVKLVHQNKLDPGEFDIWDDNKRQADEVNIPIPNINRGMNARMTQLRLQQVMGRAGYDNTQVSFSNSISGNSTTMETYTDARNDVANQIAGLEF